MTFSLLTIVCCITTKALSLVISVQAHEPCPGLPAKVSACLYFETDSLPGHSSTGNKSIKCKRIQASKNNRRPGIVSAPVYIPYNYRPKPVPASPGNTPVTEILRSIITEKKRN